IIGSLIALIGGVIAIVSFNSGKMLDNTLNTLENIFNMATMGRVGAIICFAISLILVVMDFVTYESNKKPSFVTAAFGTAAFVAQFLFNPITGMNALFSSMLDKAMSAYGSTSSYEDATQRIADSIKTQSNVGLAILILAGLALIVMGILGLAKKDNVVYVGNNSNNNYNTNYNSPSGYTNSNYVDPIPNYDISSDPDYNYKSPNNYNNG
ncbi:MAG: hypothetical protein K2N06_04635, partial [Oscillospiraceae bacterium]|nr:hypothetical protein [Oscillospiraceae bacterium]